MSQNSVNFKINNIDYSINADVDKASLKLAVDMLNGRIEKYKISTHQDESRATVLAALSLALETGDDNVTEALEYMINKIDKVLNKE